MLRDIRCCTYQSIITDFADLYHVIRYKSVSSLDQLQGSLALTNTALTRDQDTFTIYIDQYTMYRNTWSQLDIEPSDDLCHKSRSRLLCQKYRHFILHCGFQKYLIRTQVSAKYDTGSFLRKDFRIDLSLILFCHVLHVGILYKTNDLWSCLIIMFKIPRKLQRRSVDIRLSHLDPRNIYFRCQILQFQLIN